MTRKLLSSSTPSQFIVSSWWHFITGASITITLVYYVLFGPDPNSHRRTSGKTLGSGHPRGLSNLGRTCFLNALIQALAACDAFVDWIHLESDNEDECHVIQALNSAFAFVNNREQNKPKDSTTASTTVLYSLKSHGWQVDAVDQDAHELLHVLLDCVQHEHSRKVLYRNKCQGLNDFGLVERDEDRWKELLVPSHPFVGLVRKRTTRQRKSMVNNTMLTSIVMANNLMSTISDEKRLKNDNEEGVKENEVAMFNAESQGRITKLQSLIELTLPLPSQPSSPISPFLSLDNMLYHLFTDSEMLNSELKEETICGRWPTCLCIFLPRTDFKNGFIVKRRDPVLFSHLLDLSKLSPMGNSVLYKLRAVLVHIGDVECGHFITYRCYNDKWFAISDEFVEGLSCDEMKRRTREPFMLFYQKITKGIPE